jgi:hypothetical protein
MAAGLELKPSECPMPVKCPPVHFLHIYMVLMSDAATGFLMDADTDWRDFEERSAGMRASWDRLTDDDRMRIRDEQDDDLSVVITVLSEEDIERLDAGLTGLTVAPLPAARG